MTHTDLLALLEGFAAKLCPPEAAIDALKEEDLWPWKWLASRGQASTDVERLWYAPHGATYGAISSGGGEMPCRLWLHRWIGRALDGASIVIGETTYGPRHELMALAEVAALYAALPDLLKATS